MQFASQTETKCAHFPVPSPLVLAWRSSLAIDKIFETTGPSTKRDYKRVGHFKIKAIVSPHADCLTLPATMKFHPLFHVSRLEPASQDPVLGRVIPTSPPIEIESHENGKWLNSWLRNLLPKNPVPRQMVGVQHLYLAPVS